MNVEKKGQLALQQRKPASFSQFHERKGVRLGNDAEARQGGSWQRWGRSPGCRLQGPWVPGCRGPGVICFFLPVSPVPSPERSWSTLKPFQPPRCVMPQVMFNPQI